MKTEIAIKTYVRRRGHHSDQFYMIHYSQGDKGDKNLIKVSEGKKYLGKVDVGDNPEEWFEKNGYKLIPVELLDEKDNEDGLVNFLNELK